MWTRLGIQSKLLTMLLGVSVLSILITGIVSYRLASSALTDSATKELIAVNDARNKQISATFANLSRSAILESNNGSTTSAVTDLTRDFQELQSKEPTAADKAAVTSYYEKTFLPELKKSTSADVTAASVLPDTNAQWYLQSRYTAPNPDFDKAIQVDDAGDGSQWSADHAKYNPFFRDVVLQNGFDDAMLVDTNGNVIYTAYKGIDLGSNLLSGAYKDSSLTAAYKEVLRSNQVNSFAVLDYEPYLPSADAPTAFGLSPVGMDGKLIGALVIQLPVDAINNVMTGNKTWEQSGLGQTGEAFLVGPDHTLRSTSRVLLTDPKRYEELTVDRGTPPEVAAQIVSQNNPILRQTAVGPAVDQALEGKTGTLTQTDYLGRQVIRAYSPFTASGITWAVIAQIDQDEALEPVTHLFRILAAIGLGAVLLVTLLSTLLARAFTSPVKRLLGGVREIAAGNLQARVPQRGSDEFAQLAGAFNDMGSSLETKQELLDAEMEENDRIIGNLMPETVAKRFRKGEDNIVEEHQDVSVVYGTIDGLDESTASGAASLALLNDIVRTVDNVAQRNGLEKVRTLRSGYMASCGLVVPRVDHVTRCIDFAREAQREIALMGSSHGLDLKVRAGIDTGPVTSGVVGSAAIYDMWGDSVNLAYRVQADSRPGTYVTQTVYDKVRDSVPFTLVGQVQTKTGTEQVYMLDDGGRE